MGEQRPFLASAGYDQYIRLWDVGTSTSLESIRYKESQVNSIQFSPDGSQLAVAGWQHLRIYDVHVPNPPILHICDNFQKNVMSVGYEERGQWLYTGGEDNTAKVWDFRSALQCQRIFQVSAPVTAVVLHPNQVVLIVADSSGAMYTWDLRRDSSETLSAFDFEIGEYIVKMDVSRTGDHLVAVTNRGKFAIWNLGPVEMNPNGGTIMQVILEKKMQAHNRFALSCRFSPDARNFVTVGADGLAHFWNLADLTKPLDTISVRNCSGGEAIWIWDCAFTYDAQALFTISGKQIRLWDATSKKLLRQFQGHSKTITALAFRDAFYC
uniref:Target of rapamycin complex subunit lst8 n=1 Tax=Syphacia muris TaxID=451379 RepID=A0A0N5A961_9BILA